MFRSSLLALAVSSASFACSGDRPTSQGMVTATIDGSVVATSPVAGAVVSAYALDLTTGSRGELVAESQPTNSDGAFHLDLGTYHGGLLLIAHGQDASYIEPASGVASHFEASTELRGVFIESTGATPKLTLDSGETASIVLSPWSDWAFASSLVRAKRSNAASFDAALVDTLALFREHAEYDFWSVPPVSLSDDLVGAWSSRVQAGVLLAALSSLTDEMALQSSLSPAGLSSLALVASLREDLSDPLALLDGVGLDGALKLGTCAVLCPLGPSTLRGDLADAARAFLASDSNRSGIAVADAATFLMRVADRESALWPSPVSPTVAYVVSSFEDDTGVAASVDGDGVGTIAYSGAGATVTFDPQRPAHFSKYPGRYVADSPNLPEIHFLVTAPAAPSSITLRARLSRANDAGEIVVLADWFPVPSASAATFNRVLTLSSALHPDMGVVSGVYRLEFFADDDHGHTTPFDCSSGVGCLSWSQTILAPPLRQRQGSDASVCSDSDIPTAHALGDSACGSTFATTAIANLTAPRKIAQGFIDNPNPVPIQVALAVAAPATIRRGLAFKNLHLDDVAVPLLGCNRGVSPELATGACYVTTPDRDEFGTDDILDRDLYTGEILDGATATGKDAAGRTIYTIAPFSTAIVWLLAPSYGFLLDGDPHFYPALGGDQNLTAAPGTQWIKCVTTKNVPPQDPVCAAQWHVLETTSLTRINVSPASSISLWARAAGSSEALWAPATGTNVVGFNYHDFAWHTEMPGFSPL